MLNLRQLEAFRAVMISKTITRAAEMLYISQPAVSRLIADLERNVGFALFERRKGRLLPTPEAVVFYEEVERSFIGVKTIARTAQEIREFRTGSLLVAGSPAAALGYLPQVIHRFVEEHPGITVSLQIRSSLKVAEWVNSQQCDLGVVVLPVDDPAVVTEPLLRTQMVCVLPPQHRLQSLEIIRPQDLEGEVFISLGFEHRTPVDAVFAKARVKRKQQIETQLSAAACDFVLAGAGVTLADPITASVYRSRGAVTRAFEPAIPFSFDLLFPAHRPCARLTKAFATSLKQDLATRFLLQPSR